jgi:pyruvate/2-oxoglutarate dehydrogenase complex dihydrolipoamide dehydrogenase (E3) component
MAAPAVLTEETAFELTRCPEHLLALGATPHGLALAQAFRRLGAKVTVLDPGEPLAGEDSECARIVLDALGREDVAVRGGIAVTRVEHEWGRVQVFTPGETIYGSHLLFAGGRRPNVDGLGLDRARVECNEHGIVVDAALRTRNRRIYAAGDVTAGPSLTHTARRQGEIAARQALRRKLESAGVIPQAIFTDPEFAHVGLTEDAARALGSIRVLRWPYSENERAQVEGRLTGHIKIVTDRKGHILGATIVGAQARELITVWSLAINQGLDIRAVSGMMVPYPGLSDIGKRAAMTYFSIGAPQNWLQRLMGLIRR